MGFFKDIYQNTDTDGYLTIWTQQDKRCRFFRCPQELDAAEEYAEQASRTMDVYFGVGLRKEPLGVYQRGGEEDIISVPAVYIDFDIADGDSERDAFLPKTKEELQRHINTIPLQPSRIIDSGNGYHSYWEFKEAFVISTPEDRQAIKEVLRKWNLFINILAERKGYKFDIISDLARVLRVPGTLNHKTDPAHDVLPVEQSTAKYDISDLESYFESTVLQDETPSQPFKMPGKVAEGGRNNTLFSLASSLRARGMGEKAIEVALMAENIEKCDPPLSKNEIRNIARSAGKYEEGKKTRVRQAARNLDECLPGIPYSDLIEPEGWDIGHEIKKLRTIKGGEVVAEPVCAHPIFIVERLKNIDTKAEKVKVLVLRDNHWSETIEDRTTISTRKSIVDLAANGTMVNSENAGKMVTYFCDFEQANMKTLPLRQSVSRLGWVDNESFVPYTDTYEFDGDRCFREMFRSFKASGEENVWLNIAQKARENVIIRQLLATGFAAPLMYHLGRPVFITHIWGDSCTGKTVALMLAMSIWGNPKELSKTFNSTNVGMERLLGFLHHIPAALDELQTVRDKDNISNTIYNLAQGQGRTRGDRSGGLASHNAWSTTIMSTGEQPITSDKSEAGALNRSIEIEVKRDLFSGQAATVAEVISENYGFAGRKYIEGLIREIKQNPKCVLEVYKKFWNASDRFIKKEDTNDKQLSSLCAMLTADYFSSRFVFGIDTSEAEDLAWAFFEEAKASAKTTSDVDQIASGYSSFISWVASHDEHFKPIFKDPCYGVRKIVSGREYVVVLKDALDEFMREKNMSKRKMISGWSRRGWMLRGSEGDRFVSEEMINGVLSDCYVVQLKGKEVG